MILAMCSSYHDASGDTKDMNESERMRFELIINEMAASGLCCVAFAYTRVSQEGGEDLKEKKKLEEEKLTLLGLAGVEDPCRPEVKEAVKLCHGAGMKIKISTGDNVCTARAIAIECGILQSGDEDKEGAIVEGEVFRNYTLQEMMEKVDNICVLARSSPSDKLLIWNAGSRDVDDNKRRRMTKEPRLAQYQALPLAASEDSRASAASSSPAETSWLQIDMDDKCRFESRAVQLQLLGGGLGVAEFGQ